MLKPELKDLQYVSILRENFQSLSSALLWKLDKAGDDSGSPYFPAKTILASTRMGREQQTLNCPLTDVLVSIFNKHLKQF